MRTTKQLYVASLIFLSGIFVSCHDEIERIESEAQKDTTNDNVRSRANGRIAGSVYWDRANQVHNFVVGNLLTPYNSYRANTTNHVNNAWEWYQISQILADAEMVRQADTRYAPYMNNTYAWMANMWHKTATGGYYASANLNGSGAAGDKYVDDNALTGVTYLECYNVTTGTQKTNYLNSAKATANWLMNSGMWDNTFGGGFWWNTTKPLKPTQTNGLAMQLFIRLYGITGQTYYLNWANSVRTWLEANMLDATDGLFIWQIEANGTRRSEKFTYDNAIMIEAYLDFYKVTGNNTYRMKAINLAIKLNSKMWDPTRNVYKFNTNDPRVNPAWCGWASQAMIKLYKSDPNTAWLDYAQKNIDFLNTYNRNATNGGYYAFTNLNGSISDSHYEGVDQAWMQRINAQMAEYR
jgi:uncharacterized protein YyaL (SSP411 family)